MVAPSYRIAIIGSGPGGLSAASRAAEKGVSHVLLEAEAHISNTIYRYQKGKHVMDEPRVLPLRSPISFEAGKREEVLSTWQQGLENWLKSHTNKKATHAQNPEKGLYPTDDIVSRARLCMSCHYGNKDQFVSHDIMGAGHPRISFELDTFTELQPKHFTQDKDYAERKTAYTSVKAWAIGQAVATESVLQMVLSNKFHGQGMFPELSMFDCHSCHHPMSDKSWQPKRGTGLKPGSVPINDSSLLMLRHVLAQINKGDGWRFKKQVLALHTASAKELELFRQLAGEMSAAVPGFIDSIEKHNFTAADIKSMSSNILNEGIWGGYNDYVAAEQCVMAISVLTISWDNMKAFDQGLREQIKAEINSMYLLVADDEAYDQQAFRVSLVSLKEKLKL